MINNGINKIRYEVIKQVKLMFKTGLENEEMCVSLFPFMKWAILGCVNKLGYVQEKMVRFILFRNSTGKPHCFDLFAQGKLMGTSVINSLLLIKKGYKIDNFPRKREME